MDAVKTYPNINYPMVMEFKPYLENILAKVLKFALDQNTSNNTFINIAWWNMDQSYNIIECLVKLKEHWNIIVPDKMFTGPQNQLYWLLSFFSDLQNTSPEISISWNELYDLLKYSTEILNSLPYEYYHITGAMLNDLMRAKNWLKKKLDMSILDKSLQIIPQLNDLNVSNPDNICDVDNILLNILSEVKGFCSYVYSVNGFHQNSAEKNQSEILPNPIDLNNNIENYCCMLSQLIKVMLQISMYKTEEISASNIIIEDFLKAISEFNCEKKCELQRENIVNYCLMKNKNMFLKLLVYLKNNLAAVQNLISVIKQ